MERSRSYSGGWTTRPRPPRIATVKPVSKSFSEADIMKAIDDKQVSPRVFSRLKVQHITALKKDSLIGELEKCLEELEAEHGNHQNLFSSYERVEMERNQLLDDLEIAFHDLTNYMQRQKVIEEQKQSLETDCDDLVKENEYLKAVLSNRQDIRNNRMEEDNKILHERVKELEEKNTELVDEINDLYEDRQTLISSLLNLKSEEVEEVVRNRSRSSSVASRESLDERLRTENEALENQVNELEENVSRGTVDLDSCQHVLNELKMENEELKEAFKRIQNERDQAEKDLDKLREDKEKTEKTLADKEKAFNKLQEERNEKNLNVSKMNLEKRTLQRQLDHMRESNRSSASKITSLTEENESLKESIDMQGNVVEYYESVMQQRVDEEQQRWREELMKKQKECNELLASKKILEAALEESKKLAQANEIKLEKEKLLSELESSKNSLDMINKLMNDLELNNKKLTEKYNELSVEHDKLKETNKQTRDKLDKLTSESDDIKRHNTRLKSENVVIEKRMNNRVNTLEIERTKLTSAKDVVERLLRQKEESEKETCEKLQKTIQVARKVSVDNDEKVSNAQRKHDVLKKENERLLQKCRQLEKSVGELSGVMSEVKRLKEANKMLLQRYRAIESEQTNNSKSKEDEREKYSALLVKYDNICTQYDNLCKQHKQMSANFDNTIRENKQLVEHVRKVDNNKTDENKESLEKVNKELSDEIKLLKSGNLDMRRKMENDTNAQYIINNLQKDKSNLESLLQSLTKELKELKENKQKTEKDYQYIIKSHKEEARANLASKQTQIKQEKDTIKARYELLRVDIDKLNKEKEHYTVTIASLREENNKLHEQVRKHRLISNSTQDLMMQRLRDENDSLERRVEVLQNTLNKANSENKSLLDRIHRTDESVTTTIRSLKARKNELQLQVETLKHENEHLKSAASTQDVSEQTSLQNHVSNPEVNNIDSSIEEHLNESLRNAHSKMAELELENREYARKLEESEGLLYDLQRALAQANDLTMQKALEGTKTRRTLEKKVDKLYLENKELKRKMYFTGPNSGGISSNSLFSTSPIASKELHDTLSRKTSLPDTVPSRQDTVTSPLSSTSNIFSYPARFAALSVSDDNSRSNSVPESPRLAASRQVEKDLSEQLSELLDLTNNLTSVRKEDQKSHMPDESMAPPPPVNYETKEKAEQETEDPIEEILNLLTKVVTDDEKARELDKKNKLEHWV